jgi:hypothetical protein
MNLDLSRMKPEDREAIELLARLEAVNRQIDADLCAALAAKLDREIMGEIARAGR